jgi:hypothetical protein
LDRCQDEAGVICDVPVQSCFLGRIQVQKTCIGDGHNKLHFDVLDVQQGLKIKEVLPTECILVSARGASRAFPGAIRIVNG